MTQFLPKEDRYTITKGQTLARIAMALGGRVAEEVVFNEITSGAADDIKRATRLARTMVCELGMSDKLGPVAYGENNENVFLGRELTQRREDYSEDTARSIDQEVRSIIDVQHKLAHKIITENRDQLDRLAEAVRERETLNSKEITALIEGRELPEREKIVIPSWSDKREETKEKKRPASIFGAPKPAPSS